MGVVHLMDMMTDMEALRNEVLLLLIGLTHSNQSIQQIAAFEGAFERLLNIIRLALPLTPASRCQASLLACTLVHSYLSGVGIPFAEPSVNLTLYVHTTCNVYAAFVTAHVSRLQG